MEEDELVDRSKHAFMVAFVIVCAIALSMVVCLGWGFIRIISHFTS